MSQNKNEILDTLKKRGVNISSIESKEDIIWLLKNPGFERHPVCIETFLDDVKYLGAKTVRRSVKKKMIEIFGDQEYVDKFPKKILRYEEVVDMEGIGGGKTFSASIYILYGIYRVSCLSSPQSYYGKSSLSGMYFMLMSTSEKNAKDVIFTEINARILENRDGYFAKNFRPREDITTQLIFPKNIILIPGNSTVTFFVGYNIFMGVIDECDDHKKTKEKDYVEEGYQAIKQRITSRFPGLGGLMMIGSPKDVKGFMMRKYVEAQNDPNMLGIKLATWEALDAEEFSGPKFRAVDPNGVEHEIPIEYQRDLMKNPERFWRDLGAVPSLTIEPYFTMVQLVREASNPELQSWDGEGEVPLIKDATRRKEYIAHIDLGVNNKGSDHCGIAIGHVVGSKIVNDYGNAQTAERPVIKIDLVVRLSAKSDSEIQISDVRRYLLYWRDYGINYYRIQFDGWQSKDSQQILQKLGISVNQVSVDKDMVAYDALKEAIYDKRIEFGQLMVPVDDSSNVKRDIVIDELLDLRRIKGAKVDHPVDGSKDVADAIAGVVRGLTECTILHKIGVRYKPSFVKDNFDIENLEINGNKKNFNARSSGGKRSSKPKFAGGDSGFW